MAIVGIAGVLPGGATTRQMLAAEVCHSVAAAASAGVSFGVVVSGETYFYQASGCVARNLDRNAYNDPDGNEHSDPGCTQFMFANIANNAFTCPGLTSYSLVGKINGGPCLPLGSSGSFTAAASGELVLYCNDDVYGDNSGSWNVCVDGVTIPPAPGICAKVSAGSSSGTSFSNVVAGQTYAVFASGLCAINYDGALADPDGNKAGTLSGHARANRSFACPHLWAWSLVGEVRGICVQLGSHRSFVAPATGELRALFNDNIYQDNGGEWDVCVAVAVPVDIDPGVCPNSLTPTPGTVSVAVCGTAPLDVEQIDVGTLRLEGVSPFAAELADVARPVKPYIIARQKRRCGRHSPDGVVDLVLTFDRQSLYDALTVVAGQQTRVLRLTGTLIDGTPIVGEDVVLVNGQ